MPGRCTSPGPLLSVVHDIFFSSLSFEFLSIGCSLCSGIGIFACVELAQAENDERVWKDLANIVTKNRAWFSNVSES